MRKISIKGLKKKAWKVFSDWTRRKNSDKNGYTKCITCATIMKWHKLHAGHFIHGRSKKSYMIEENVNPQCARCNTYLSGNLILYYEFMLRTYGQEKIDEIKNSSKQIWKPTRDELLAIISKYKHLVEKLKMFGH